MAGDLTLRITVTEIETLQKNRLHVAGECGRRGRCGHQHFVAAVDQVPRAGLMKRRCELVVDVPAIMDEKSVESRSQQTGSFLVAAAGQDAVDRRVAGDRDPQPPGVSSHFPARFVHGHAGTHPDLADEILVGRFALFSQARQSLAQPAGSQWHRRNRGYALAKEPLFPHPRSGESGDGPYGRSGLRAFDRGVSDRSSARPWRKVQPDASPPVARDRVRPSAGRAPAEVSLFPSRRVPFHAEAFRSPTQLLIFVFELFDSMTSSYAEQYHPAQHNSN